MYPYEVIFGMTLYDIFLSVGVISALLIVRLFADYDKVSAKLFNFILLVGACAIALGYFSAVVFQAIYNWLDGGEFIINSSTGATFLGGLVGGVATFLIGYFVLGHFIFPDKYNIKYFPRLLDIAAVCITSAHGFGRLGCLMAGCCYGTQTDSWCGIYHVALDAKVVPMQLFEAIFLFTLSIVLAILVYRRVPGTMGIYMSCYGLWRFVAEYFRDDYRGSTFIDFLTPSQLTAVCLMLGSVFIFLYTCRISRWTEVKDESC